MVDISLSVDSDESYLFFVNKVPLKNIQEVDESLADAKDTEFYKTMFENNKKLSKRAAFDMVSHNGTTGPNTQYSGMPLQSMNLQDEIASNSDDCPNASIEIGKNSNHKK